MTIELKSSDSVRRPKKLVRNSKIITDRREDWKLGLPPYVEVPAHDISTLLAIGGGKGGVGKSILSANIASRLAQLGYRVLVIDMDLGCANLHTHFGIPKPKYTLADFILEGDRQFHEIITPTTMHGVALVAGGQEAAWGRQLARGAETLLPLWEAIFSAKQQLQVDFVVMDLGAGTLRHTMEFFSAAHLGVMTVLPEPTSIENAYVFLKSHLWHLIDNIAARQGADQAATDLRALLLKNGNGGMRKGYVETFQGLSATYPEFIGDLYKALAGRSVGVVINQTRSQADIDIGVSMEMICKRYFGVHANFLGDLNYDDSAWKSLRNRRLLLNDFPHSVLARRLYGVTNRVLEKLGFQI